jgi:hypothetical protein
MSVAASRFAVRYVYKDALIHGVINECSPYRFHPSARLGASVEENGSTEGA